MNVGQKNYKNSEKFELGCNFKNRLRKIYEKKLWEETLYYREKQSLAFLCKNRCSENFKSKNTTLKKWKYLIRRNTFTTNEAKSNWSNIKACVRHFSSNFYFFTKW